MIDDHEDNRELIAIILRAEGVTTLMAENGAAGLEVLKRQRPCLILLDLAMPIMNGWQFRARQLEHAELRSIPVVLYSAHPDLAQEAGVLGATGIVTKPVDAGHLISIVKSVCHS